MEKKFGKHMQDVWCRKTLGMPNFLTINLMVGNEKISAKDQ